MMMILLIMVVVEQATSFHPQPPTLAPAQLPHFSGSQDTCIHVICAYKCEFKCLWRRPFSVEYMDCVADCMQDCLPRTTTDVNTFTPACPKFGFGMYKAPKPSLSLSLSLSLSSRKHACSHTYACCIFPCVRLHIIYIY
jgi:hypothetical protein